MRSSEFFNSCFLCAIAGIANEHTDRNTTAYILIVHAAANAQKGVDSILVTRLESEGEREEAAISGFLAIESILWPTLWPPST